MFDSSAFVTVPRNGPHSTPAPRKQPRELRVFLGMFYEMLEEMADSCYFTEKYGDECSDRHPIYWSSQKIRHSIAIHALDLDWPLTPDNLDWLDREATVRYVEFFYKAVSKPVDGWDHPYCEGWHPTSYDRDMGRIEYERRVNSAFKQSGVDLTLVDGRVQLQTGRGLQLRLTDNVDYLDDSHIERVVESALTMFRGGDETQQVAALSQLANVFERLKKRLGNGDKRSAVAFICDQRRMDVRLADYLEKLFKTTGEISNETMIRHHEDDRIPISGQPDLIEFLFYHYYNLIRFCLTIPRLSDEVLDVCHEKPLA